MAYTADAPAVKSAEKPVIRAEIAASGDLGYSYGAALRKAGPSAAPEAGGYLRVWRRSERGVWQVALELHAMPRR